MKQLSLQILYTAFLVEALNKVLSTRHALLPDYYVLNRLKEIELDRLQQVEDGARDLLLDTTDVHLYIAASWLSSSVGELKDSITELIDFRLTIRDLYQRLYGESEGLLKKVGRFLRLTP